MFPIFAALIYAASSQFPSAVYPYDDPARLLETADAIVVAEYVGYVGE